MPFAPTKSIVTKLALFTLVTTLFVSTPLPTLALQTPPEAAPSTIDHQDPTDSVTTQSTPEQSPPSDHSDSDDHSGGHGAIGTTLLTLAVILFASKLGGAVEQFNVPRVLGELTAGVILSFLAFYGADFLTAARSDQIIAFLAELGVIILLFEIGLESNVRQLIKVGPNSLAVALIGAATPFAIGTLLIGPWLFPEASNHAYLFIGATLVATSVGISASIFQNLGKTKTRAFQTFLGATLTDDVLGLITLAVVSSIVTGGQVTVASVSLIIAKAVTFLGAAVVLGSFSAPYISKGLSKIHTGTGMKLGLAVTAAIFFAYLATLVGLAPIIGAFAAGLVLDAVHFQNFESPGIVAKLQNLAQSRMKAGDREKLEHMIHEAKHTHIEDMIHSLSLIFVPLFFTYTGLLLDAQALMNPQVYFIAIVVTAIAVATKVIGGFAAKGTLQEKLLVGFSMAPRGEVGLIFATMGKTLGVFSTELFSAMVLVTFLTTFVAIPPIKMLAIKIKSAPDEDFPDLKHAEE